MGILIFMSLGILHGEQYGSDPDMGPLAPGVTTLEPSLFCQPCSLKKTGLSSL